MAIVVCMKQVPADIVAATDENGMIERKNGNFCLNPADYYALEAALRMKEKYGETVIALCMGTNKSMDILHEAAAIGADEIILLNDEIFAGSDTQATSYILAKAIKKIGDVRAVFCGRQSKDGDTGQTGAELSEKLDFFLVTNVSWIDYIDMDSFSYVRQMNEGQTKGVGNYPAVFTVNRMIGECRIASIKGILRAEKIQPVIWDRHALNVNAERCGRKGSPTRVTKIYESEKMHRMPTVWDKPIPDIAKEIIKEIRQLNMEFRSAISNSVYPDVEVDEYSITMEQLAASGNICIFAESRKEEILESVFQMISYMYNQIDKGGQQIDVWYVGEKLPFNYEKIFYYGARGMYWFESGLIPIGNERSYMTILEQAVEKLKPRVLLFTATEFGKALAAMLASRIGTGLTADCIDLIYDCKQKQLLQIRPVFSGMKKAEIKCGKMPQMATVRSNIFPKPEIILKTDNKFWIRKVCDIVQKIEKDYLEYRDLEETSIQNAEIIFIGGKGLKSRENFERMVGLTKKLGISAGATRMAVDAGWASYSRQIGLTGAIVQVKLCVLFGVSGAEEHRVGISSADRIIAINTDTAANIFQYADINVISDAEKILEEMERMEVEQK